LSEDHAISELKPYGKALACALARCCAFSSRRFLFNTLLAANSNLFAFSLLAHHLPLTTMARATPRFASLALNHQGEVKGED
jgi:hypothetical protein